MTVEVIIEKLQALNIKRVALFDDEIELIENPWQEDIAWQSIFDAYTFELEEALGSAKVNEFRNLETIEERLSALKTIEQFLEKEQLEALEEETVKILRLWINKLENFGLEVDRFADFNDFKDRFSNEEEYKAHLRNYHLILLDFSFKNNSDDNHSQSISEEISTLLYPLASETAIIPPILIRFSSLDQCGYSLDEKRKFVKKIGFARGCYDFLRKNLINEEDKFISNIIRIIRDAEYGRPLYTLSLNVAKTISQTAATDMMRILYQLDPESIRIISEQRLQAEGITALDYFSKLFLGLLNHTIAGSKEVVEATKNFLDSINTQPEPISTFEHDGLDYVQNRFLFDYEVNSFQKPINFGDIFLFKSDEQNQVAIVITQACDMTIRGQVSKQNSSPDSQKSTKPSFPKVEYIMLLTGTLISLSEATEKSERYTKFFTTSLEDEHYVAIRWNFKNTITLPRALLDLVSLNPKGNVELPLGNFKVESQWWTEAYQEYIIWAYKFISDNYIELPQKDNEQEWAGPTEIDDDKIKKIILPGTISNAKNLSSMFGNALMFLVEKNDEALIFPIQRIARLQLNEALDLQHTYHTNASRIGVMLGLGQGYNDVTVELYDEEQKLFDKISAKRFKMKDWSALMVDSEELENACDKNNSFLNLARFAIDERPYVDLEKISRQQGFSAEYTLTQNGTTWKIQRKQKKESSNKSAKQKKVQKAVELADIQPHSKSEEPEGETILVAEENLRSEETTERA